MEIIADDNECWVCGVEFDEENKKTAKNSQKMFELFHRK